MSYLNVPVEVKEAAKNNKLVFFVGTGVSMNLGAPNWVGFAKNVLNQLRERGIINSILRRIDRLSYPNNC